MNRLPSDPPPDFAVPPPSEAEAQALAWFFRQREGRLAAREQAAFDAWLAAAPAHAREYAQLQAVWQEMDALPAAASGPARASAATARPAPAARTPPVRWRRAAAALAGVAILGTAGVLAHRQWPIESTRLASGAQEAAAPIALSDGTRIRGGVDTRLSVRYTRTRREVRLEQGEAFFDVGADPRPFSVAVGPARIRDIGTEFNVLALPALLQVGVRSGRVALQPDAGQPGGELLLDPGDVATLPRGADGTAGPPRVSHGAAAAVGSWRDGLLVVQAEPLALVAQKLSRYRAAPIRLADAEAGALTVSGTIDLRRPDAFLRALPGLLPMLQVQWQSDGSVVIARR